VNKICLACKEFKEHYGKGLCKNCYGKKWRKDNPEYNKYYGKKWYKENPIYYKKWQKNNPEKVKNARKKYYLGNTYKEWAAENKEKIRKKNKKYYSENKEKAKEWAAENKEKIRKKNKKYYSENKEKAKIFRKKWQGNNPEKVREENFRRRTNGKIEKGVIAKIINENILKYGIITCEKCKKQCLSSYDYHVDHIVPISKGGTNDCGNLQVLCAYCNLNKHTEIADYRQISKNSQIFLTISGGEN